MSETKGKGSRVRHRRGRIANRVELARLVVTAAGVAVGLAELIAGCSA